MQHVVSSECLPESQPQQTNLVPIARTESVSRVTTIVDSI
jgi:hypothetical protein